MTPRCAPLDVPKPYRRPSSLLFNAPGVWHDRAMATITLQKAQQDLPALIQRVLDGEDIVIGTEDAAVRLTPVAAVPHSVAEPAPQSYRGRGALKGQLTVGPEFFKPLSDEECGVAVDPSAT